MDTRCPRSLSETPIDFCPLAVMRLRAIRTAGKELSEDEEAKLPGCVWAVNHQMSNYCFFKYVQEYADDKPPTDIEIASLNCISIETVKKIEKAALSKIKNIEEFKILKDLLAGESAVVDHDNESPYSIKKK